MPTHAQVFGLCRDVLGDAQYAQYQQFCNLVANAIHGKDLTQDELRERIEQATQEFVDGEAVVAAHLRLSAPTSEQLDLLADAIFRATPPTGESGS